MVIMKQMVWEPKNILKYFWFTSCEQSSCTLLEEKQNSVYSLKYPNKESGKIFKNKAAEPYFKACLISLMEHFFENTNG